MISKPSGHFVTELRQLSDTNDYYYKMMDTHHNLFLQMAENIKYET